MAVKIRLSRQGTTKKPTYRVVVIDARKPQSGSTLEIVGTYQPQNKKEQIVLKSDRIQYWLSQGAVPTETVRSLLKKVPQKS